MTKTRRKQSAVGAMYAGLGLTVVAMIVPWIDLATGNVLAGHIRAGYPTFPQDRIDTAVMTWLVCLSVVGALGIIWWFFAIWAVRAGKRWARSVATLVFALSLSVALFALLVRDSSGDTGLPPLLGWVGMVPSLAGLLAVALLWRGSRPTSQA
ncbi:hypothetical protein [Microtetraspora sp. NBRC 16547]|uniref:hypothetical protein n=1 Tax=Microtetraspora sp. NBRC 16547 TaxID=3030993 RepID=UPI0024A51A1B|nr:hypothetical protein [Microtetraspora sp. NBRC 16547]GLW96074.1 hypothetical protein Misp02_01610 [Microtetraspora sp. NBRC 16547]